MKERFLLLILATIQFTHILDFMIIMPLGSQFMKIFDISPQQFSFIVSVYAISAFIFGFISATYIDRYDRKTALIYNYIGFTIGTIACSLATDYFFFLIARSVAGAFGGVLSALVLSVVGDVIPFERRASAMSVVMTAFSVASVIGVPVGIYFADLFSWRFPFMAVGIISILVIILMFFVLPSMKEHLSDHHKSLNPLDAIRNIFSDPNQKRALLFTITMMMGHFTIIPFIAPYMQINIGLSNIEVGYLYAVGGTLTVFLLPLVGYLSDRFGNLNIFTISSILALFSIFLITNLPAVSLFIALCATSSYFVVASGRNVPAATMVTAVVKPESRGSFMSVRTSMNEMAMGLGSFIAGSIITENAAGQLMNYPYVGYIAIFMSILAILFARRLKAIS